MAEMRGRRKRTRLYGVSRHLCDSICVCKSAYIFLAASVLVSMNPHLAKLGLQISGIPCSV